MSIGLLAGSIAKTAAGRDGIANLVILPMAFLGGAFIPLDYAPNWIKEVSYVMPLRYLVTGMQDVMARGVGPASALPAIGSCWPHRGAHADRCPGVPLGRYLSGTARA